MKINWFIIRDKVDKTYTYIKEKWIYVFNTVKKKKNSPTDDMILYIGGSETLPPPLSREEEKECLLALATEQEESARKKLIAHNLRLVVYLARKFENTGVCVEDLISIGTIGLIKGIHTFNPEKNINLAT